MESSQNSSNDMEHNNWKRILMKPILIDERTRSRKLRMMRKITIEWGFFWEEQVCIIYLYRKRIPHYFSIVIMIRTKGRKRKKRRLLSGELNWNVTMSCFIWFGKSYDSLWRLDIPHWIKIIRSWLFLWNIKIIYIISVALRL